MGVELRIVIVVICVLCSAVLIGVVFLRALYRSVDQGQALIVNRSDGRSRVSFTGAVVLPVIQRAEVMDIALKTMEIDRRGRDGVTCNDKIRADVTVTFFFKVNKAEEDVLKVASSIGCARASDAQTLRELFTAKFSEAIKQVAAKLDFSDIYQQREIFRDQLFCVIGDDLNGFRLEDVAVDYLEQTALEHLDPNNILDAEGIRKIKELTAEQDAAVQKSRDEQRIELEAQQLETASKLDELRSRRSEVPTEQALGATNHASLELGDERASIDAQIERLQRELQSAQRRASELNRDEKIV